MSITSIEYLSNEIFYEIFDYLDAWDIYAAFSNLNYCFEQLINNSSFLYKIKLIDRTMCNDILIKIWTKIAHLNRKQVFSIHLCMSTNTTELALLLFIDLSFHRLQSIVLIRPVLDTLLSILGKLIHLPRLCSLTIEKLYFVKDLTAIYRLILALPMLTYYKISTEDSNQSVSLPISIQSSPLEHLIMNYNCNFNDLSMVLSYTPQLRHLAFMESNENITSIQMIIPSIPLHLTYLRIHVTHVIFDEFEIFIRQLCPKLKVLMFSTSSEDIAYMDACRWKRFLLQDLPDLKKFSLQYHESNYDKDELNMDFRETNPFFSSFWLDRQWIFEIEINCKYFVYSVCPYKKRWYEQPNVDHSTMKFSESIRLAITDIIIDEYYHLMVMDIETVLRVTQIHHLEISNRVSIDILIQITNALPQVTTMKLHSLSLDKAIDSETDALIVFPSKQSINQITKVYLETVSATKEIYSLIKKYQNMSYLKINSFINVEMDVFIRNILKKINRQFNQSLRVLCFRARATESDVSMVHTIKKMKTDCTINHVDGFTFVQWK